jgi:diguanylate cyclase (GGDEF)-like protein
LEKPDTPRGEKSRLATLQSLGVLDTPAEERFDRLARLARRMFDVPIALVSLVDENRQWFKSCQGLDVSETPRDISFCGHAILGDDIFVIPDATKDPRFADNPLVSGEPLIRFYAGCPLQDVEGNKMGTLCIIDKRPRSLDLDDLDTFRDLAALAERELIAVQLATLDDLTGIPNRRGFNALAQYGLDFCNRQNIPASLAFFDLNDFKRINDTFGHAEGDTALIAFADRMRHVFRESDVLARLGGDEFAVLLSGLSGRPTQAIVDRFRDAVDTYSKEADRGYAITFCAGVVSVDPGQDHSISTLLSRADTLMYKNKER